MTYPRRAALLTRVREIHDVTPHMREISLTGPDVPHLRLRPGAHVVARIPGAEGYARRVYSIWRHDPRTGLLVLRVALHDAGGPGCTWARGVAVDDRIGVEPPRTKITVDESAKFHLFIGDETGAVPLLAMRAALHRSSRGAAVVHGVFEASSPEDEVPDVDGVPPLPWVHRGRSSAVASPVLLRAVQDLELPTTGGAAYIAAESDTCRLLQRHLIEQRGWSRHAIRVQQQWAADRPGFGAGRD
ncbi:siderophore-interacting protein [Paractinoplanes maris]|uniref:siderophore-interacting protein n=1 Tax=Paractinoplanes maris TaxID=1734446 RepID=UPI0020200AD7|nr:siderophore-interacting protein [Actinoplanes maris]